MQIPASFFPRLQPIASLLGGIICLLTLAAYCTYQVATKNLLMPGHCTAGLLDLILCASQKWPTPLCRPATQATQHTRKAKLSRSSRQPQNLFAPTQGLHTQSEHNRGEPKPVFPLLFLRQVVYPELQRRQITRARKRRLQTSVLKGLASTASPFGSLLLPSGDLNDEVCLKAEYAVS